MSVALLDGEQRLECPNCLETATFLLTDRAKKVLEAGGTMAQTFHQCRGLQGMLAPLVPAGLKCKVEAIEREDYVGDEVVQTNGEGRPIMAVQTTREDGTDRAVFAPTATSRRD